MRWELEFFCTSPGVWTNYEALFPVFYKNVKALNAWSFWTLVLVCALCSDKACWQLPTLHCLSLAYFFFALDCFASVVFLWLALCKSLISLEIFILTWSGCGAGVFCEKWLLFLLHWDCVFGHWQLYLVRLKLSGKTMHELDFFFILSFLVCLFLFVLLNVG